MLCFSGSSRKHTSHFVGYVYTKAQESSAYRHGHHLRGQGSPAGALLSFPGSLCACSFTFIPPTCTHFCLPLSLISTCVNLARLTPWLACCVRSSRLRNQRGARRGSSGCCQTGGTASRQRSSPMLPTASTSTASFFFTASSSSGGLAHMHSACAWRDGGLACLRVVWRGARAAPSTRAFRPKNLAAWLQSDGYLPSTDGCLFCDL